MVTVVDALNSISDYQEAEELKSRGIALGEDDDLEAGWVKQHSLAEFLDPKNFKSYSELKTKLESVLTGAANAPRAEETQLEDIPRPVALKPVPKKETSFDDADESLSYFAKLANSDE